MLTRSKTKENETQTSTISKPTMGSKLRRRPACDSCRRSKKRCTHKGFHRSVSINHTESDGVIKNRPEKHTTPGSFQKMVEQDKKKKQSEILTPDPKTPLPWGVLSDSKTTDLEIENLGSHGEGLHHNTKRLPSTELLGMDEFDGYRPLHTSSTRGDTTLPISNNGQESSFPRQSSFFWRNLPAFRSPPNDPANSRSETSNRKTTSEELREVFNEIKTAVEGLRESTRDVQGKLKQWNETWKRHEQNLKDEQANH